jgi:hypothetical protein
MSYFGIPIRNGLPIGLGTVAPLGINTFSPFSPASLFANGEQGWWYDPSNFATLYQDSAGTTPVTAVEQPVGLQLDLSGRGNHRFQSTSANRPVVSARVNLLTKTEQFDDAGWTKSNVTVVANATTAPDGTLTADKIYPTSTGTSRFLFQAPGGPSGFYKWSLRAKAAEKSIVYMDFAGGAGVNAFFNLSTGTVGTVSAGYTATITNLGNGWYECAATNNTATAVGFGGIYGVADANGSTSVTTNGTDGIFIWGADFRPTNQGVDLPAYQRVNTSTDYDSTGFPVYIKPNGANQSMQTNSINFTVTDAITLWMGLRNLSSTTGMINELSTTNSQGAWYLINNSGTSIRYEGRGARAASASDVADAAITTPETGVFTAAQNINGNVPNTIRKNGALSGSSVNTTFGGGNFGNFPAYFYARAGNSLLFNGNDYGSIAGGAAYTAAQITGGETYMAAKTGVTLLVETFDFITTDAGDQIVTDDGDSVITDIFYA